MKQLQERGQGTPIREDPGGPWLMGNRGRSSPKVSLPPASLCLDPAKPLHSKDVIRTPGHQTTASLWPPLPLSLSPFFICTAFSPPVSVRASTNCSQPQLPRCFFKGQLTAPGQSGGLNLSASYVGSWWGARSKAARGPWQSQSRMPGWAFTLYSFLIILVMGQVLLQLTVLS